MRIYQLVFVEWYLQCLPICFYAWIIDLSYKTCLFAARRCLYSVNTEDGLLDSTVGSDVMTPCPFSVDVERSDSTTNIRPFDCGTGRWEVEYFIASDAR